MHILLTDILTCPRCGPTFGLIVLADSVVDRHVEAGSLGCANCRSMYPIRAGVADLRIHPPVVPSATPSPMDEDRALRLAALSGLGERSGMMMMRGADPSVVAAVGEHLPNAQIFGASEEAPGLASSSPLSWILHGGALPVRDRSLFAATLVGTAPGTLEEAERTIVPGGRIVVENASEEVGPLLAGRGWTILLEQDGVAVASRPVRG